MKHSVYEMAGKTLRVELTYAGTCLLWHESKVLHVQNVKNHKVRILILENGSQYEMILEEELCLELLGRKEAVRHCEDIGIEGEAWRREYWLTDRLQL